MGTEPAQPDWRPEPAQPFIHLLSDSQRLRAWGRRRQTLIQCPRATAMASILSSSPTLRHQSHPFSSSSSSSHPLNRNSSAHGVVNFTHLTRPRNNLVSSKLSLRFSRSIAPELSSIPLRRRNGAISYRTPKPQPPSTFTVFCAKGFKMKTHKASAKRFRVTGSGKIMRRRAGKQHLLAKKNTKRKLRLSKMVQVKRSDYNNVIGALPYLKVNRSK
ncbi:hypothetical protein Dimus_002471 [Dionaea muscipula]